MFLSKSKTKRPGQKQCQWTHNVILIDRGISIPRLHALRPFVVRAGLEMREGRAIMGSLRRIRMPSTYSFFLHKQKQNRSRMASVHGKQRSINFSTHSRTHSTTLLYILTLSHMYALLHSCLSRRILSLSILPILVDARHTIYSAICCHWSSSMNQIN